MATWIRKPARHHCERFVLAYTYRNDRNAGFAFDCDKDGNLLPQANELARENLRKCEDGTYDVVGGYIERYAWTYTEPGVIKCCHCGTHVELHSPIANTCPRCNADYNLSGQLLAPREQWGEETGESLADIFSSYDPEEIRV